MDVTFDLTFNTFAQLLGITGISMRAGHLVKGLVMRAISQARLSSRKLLLKKSSVLRLIVV